MKRTLQLSTFLLIGIILLACSDYEASIANTAITPDKKAKIDTTKYAITGFNHGMFLGLLSDNTFYYRNKLWSCFGGGDTKHISGKYEKEKNKITLQPTQVTTTSYEDYPLIEDEEDSYANSSKTKTYSYLEEETKIKTEYYIVTIDNKSYVLSEEKKDNYMFEESPYNDFEILAASLKKRKPKEPIFGGILSRQTNDTTLFTIEQIPTKWRFLFK